MGALAGVHGSNIIWIMDDPTRPASLAGVELSPTLRSSWHLFRVTLRMEAHFRLGHHSRRVDLHWCEVLLGACAWVSPQPHPLVPQQQIAVIVGRLYGRAIYPNSRRLAQILYSLSDTVGRYVSRCVSDRLGPAAV